MAAKEKRGLGIGLDALFGPDLQTEPDEIRTLPLSQVEPRQDQPRESFDEERLQDLAASISRHGLIQPVIVRRLEDGYYQIIAGERRWRAAKMAGLSEIPAVVLDGDDLKAAQISIIENVQREDLNPIEEALAYRALIEKFDLTQEQVAKQVGKNRSTVANLLRLLDLPEEVLALLQEGKLTTGHARALLGLNDEAQIAPLAQRIVEKDLSVRDVERTIRLLNYEKGSVKKEDSAAVQRKVYMKDLEHRAVERLGRRVRILKTAKKKVVELAYSDDEDLEALLSSICGADFFTED